MEGKEQLPVVFYSRMQDHEILMNDRMVTYMGNKEIETHPTTKIRFKKGRYVCRDQKVYDFLIGSEKFKRKIIMLQPVVKPKKQGLMLGEDMLMRLLGTELEGLCQQLKISPPEGASKSDIVGLIMEKQGSFSVEKAETPNATKGVVAHSAPVNGVDSVDITKLIGVEDSDSKIVEAPVVEAPTVD